MPDFSPQAVMQTVFDAIKREHPSATIEWHPSEYVLCASFPDHDNIYIDFQAEDPAVLSWEENDDE